MKKYSLIIIAFMLLSIVSTLIYWYYTFYKVQTNSTLSAKERQTMYLRNENYMVQITMFDLYKTQKTDIVMLGDSHSFNTNWNELLNRANIINRGIPSDITSGYLHRLQYVYNLNPKICFIEGGVNDFYSKYTVNEAMQNLTQVIDTLKLHKIIPVVTATFFVAINRDNAFIINEQINKLNKLLSDYCQSNSIDYIDINPLISTNDYLRPEFSYDGLHLRASAYAIWAKDVDKILIKHDL